MDWFKFYADFFNDPKMRRYFSKSERNDWVSLMCLAAKSKERGVILMPDDEIAYALELEDEEWTTLRSKFIERRMCNIREDGALVLTNFAARQYDKPSDRPEATAERKRAQRMREKEQKEQVSRPVTPCHATEETRLEEKRLDTEEIITDDRQTQGGLGGTISESPQVVRSSGRPDKLEKEIGIRLPSGNQKADTIRQFMGHHRDLIPDLIDAIQGCPQTTTPLAYAHGTVQIWIQRERDNIPFRLQGVERNPARASPRRLTPSEQKDMEGREQTAAWMANYAAKIGATGQQTPLSLPDPNTIDGEFREVKH